MDQAAAAAEEEFANLKEKAPFVCDYFKPPVIYDWQMRKPDNWGGQRRQQENEKDKPLYCFAISFTPGSLKDEEDLSRDGFIIKIFILVPEHCSLYHFANFRASSDGIACVAANSKIYLFGGGCGTHIFYMDLVGLGHNSKQGKVWKQAKACFKREKCNPLSFSLGNKIYALETLYLPTSNGQVSDDDDDDDDCRFEVLDTSSDASCWLPLPNPPYPFGACEVVGSWSSDGCADQGDGYRIFIDTVFAGSKYLFVYDVDTNTWDQFKRYNPLRLVDYPPDLTAYRPFYSWALHSVGKDFAPFPPHVPYTGDLRVLTGLKRSIPQLKQLASENKKGLSLPFPVKVETDRKKVTVECKKSSRRLTGWDLESLWTLHCLPVEGMIFWQAIHLGGSSFCTLAYYLHSSCCCSHTYLYVRVANFDITDAAAAGGATEPVFSAEYGANKVYLVSKAVSASPLPCSLFKPDGVTAYLS